MNTAQQASVGTSTVIDQTTQAWLLLAGIEVARRAADPGGERVVDDVAARQRLHLLEHESQQDGEKTHPGRS